MAEKILLNGETQELSLPEGQHELLISSEASNETVEVSKSEINATIENDDRSRKILEESRKIIETESINSEKLSEEIAAKNIEKSQSDGDQPSIISAENSRYIGKQKILSIQKKLNPKDRAISKVINNNLVEAFSETASKTVARPSGFLGGAILAFIGSLAYLVFVKYVGINYNYLLFFVFFISGFVLGLIIELIVRLVHKS